MANARVGTEWNSGEIWLRKEFQLNSAVKGSAVIRVFHDEDAVIHLNGMTLTTGILFVFDSLTLQPNEYAVVVSNRPAFTFRYGASAKVLGEYQQHLGNGGDHIELTGAFGEPILSFTYEDQWHKTTDGEGPALEVIALQAGRSAWEAPQHWRASTEGGSPGLPSLAMPTNQRPRLNAQRLSENQFSLELIGTSNSTYIMEWSPDLKSWTEHSRETTDASGLGKVTIHLPPNGATTYYRARESSSARLP